MYFTTEEILKALREGATDADIANQFATALNEASKLHTEETKAKAEKETLYANCADAFNAVLKAEGIDGDEVNVDDIHSIINSIKTLASTFTIIKDTLSPSFLFSTQEKAPKRGHRAEIKPTADNDEDIIKSFLASLS